MRQFIVFVEGVDDEFKPKPELIEAESFMALLHVLDEKYNGDFEMWLEAPKFDEEVVAEHINQSNGDGDRWYSISEIVDGKLLIWLG